jgi:competence protein ComEA
MEYTRKYWYIILIVIATLGYMAFSARAASVFQEEEEREWENSISANEGEQVKVETEEEALVFFVDIKGEVMRPGVYEVDNNRRVIDLIDMAGGFTDSADQNVVNLAQKMTDEMVIYIPKQGEGTSVIPQNLQGSKQEGGIIDINVAQKEELDSLPGIGPQKAEAIITYREENGRFKSIEELVKVPGIGEKTLDSLKEYITIK